MNQHKTTLEKNDIVLTVIAEVEVEKKGNYWFTRDRSFNEILREYAQYFCCIHYIGPGDQDITGEKSPCEGVYVSSIAPYDRRWKRRLGFLLRPAPKVVEKVNNFKPELDKIIQFRVPSIFSLKCALELKDQNFYGKTAYVAGEWGTSFPASHPGLLAKPLGRALQAFERHIIKDYIKASAGDVIAKQFKKNGGCFAYRSSSHRELTPRLTKNRGKAFIFVGRLEPRKRVCDLIEAFYRLISNDKNATLTIIGDGPERSLAEKRVREKELEEHVHFVGNITDSSELSRYYKEADVLVLPSVSEGTPKVLPEAMSFGVIPVACRNVGSIDYVIEDGRNGILFEAKDIDQLTKILSDINNCDQSSRDAMVAECYAYAESHTLPAEVEKLWTYVITKIERS